MKNTVNIYTIGKKLLYSHKCVNNTLKITIEKAISENADLRFADLCNADLRNADLRFADLCNADLRNADLRNADLRNAILCNADLCNADLCNTELRNADLRNAILCNADLCNADLCNADFCNANLYNAILEYCLNYYSFIAYDTTRRSVHCIKHDNSWMIKAGCFWGTLEELEHKVKNTHNSQVYLSNINILKKL